MTDKDTILRALARDPKNALEIGKAAEHIVCADLMLQGFRAFLSDQGLAYDIVVDHRGKLIRVQVKATCFPRNVNSTGKNPRQAYYFNVRRRGKNGEGVGLSEADCDIVAFCGLNIRQVAYLPITACSQTVYMMPPGAVFEGAYKRRRHETIEGYPFSSALAEIVGGEI